VDPTTPSAATGPPAPTKPPAPADATGSTGPGTQGSTGNPWLDERRVANIAHAGGIDEAPQNTLYAFATAVERGADVLELDLHLTGDGHVVVIHDSTVDRTTDGTGCVVDHTLEKLRELDAAFTHVQGEGQRDGRPLEQYEFRGIATGDRAAPEGFGPEDFRIPTLEEVFLAHPEGLFTVDLKATERETRGGVEHDCPAVGVAPGRADRPDLPTEVARLIERHGVGDRVLVASFLDPLMDRFKGLAPDVDTVFPLRAALQVFEAWVQGRGSPPNPDGHVALQVPRRVEVDGRKLEIGEDLVRYAHAHAIAVHVWTIDDRAEQQLLLDWGVDGLITDRVTQLDRLLTERGARRPPR
jgi:glycerophosphoryl diester phosphodiesterase